MQRDRLQELLQHPERVHASDRDGLLAWREKYPFAGAIAMLLARASSMGGHIDQEQDLLRAAAHGTFRQPLFDLILRMRIQEEAAAVEAWIESTELDLEQQADEMPAAAESEGGTLDPEVPLEREALIAAIGRTIESEVDNWETEVAEIEDFDRVRNAVASPFALWLSARAQAVGFGETLPNKVSPLAAPEGMDSRALIDRFITLQPKMGKLREVASSVEDWANESILEDPTLVTETMARIYAQQGKLNKARKAYRQLALKYPAKSIYFASQLKKLEATVSGSSDSNE